LWMLKNLRSSVEALEVPANASNLDD
jgi:hypothetical protein